MGSGEVDLFAVVSGVGGYFCIQLRITQERRGIFHFNLKSVVISLRLLGMQGTAHFSSIGINEHLPPSAFPRP